MAYTTSQVAQRLQLTAATIRNYTQEFSRHLSPGARPGQPRRRFGEQDIRTLYVASQLLALGLTYHQVNERLGEGITHLVLEFELETPDFEPDLESQHDPTSTALLSAEQMRLLMQPLADALEEWRGIAEERRRELERKEEEIQQLRQALEEARRPWWQFWR